MNQTKYIALCTPKAFSKTQSYAFPEHLKDVEIIATAGIYMNLMDSSWTEEMCDNVVYIVERASLDQYKIGFKL